MKYVYKCSKRDCYFSRKGIELEMELAEMDCPICHGKMYAEKGNHWLDDAFGNKEIFEDSTGFPCVIARDLMRLHDLCQDHNSYGVLLCIKDNFEALLKFETLIAYAWAANNTALEFVDRVISQITTRNLSMGMWVELAKMLTMELEKAEIPLPGYFPLDTIVKLYQKHNIVGWRNAKIGHGVLGFEDDLAFQNDIKDKIKILISIYDEVSAFLRKQILYQSISDNTSIPLVGADSAVNLRQPGLVSIEVIDQGGQKIDAYSVDPYIITRPIGRDRYGVFFFDNQKKTTLTSFQAYADGIREDEPSPYFEKLRRTLDSSNKRLELHANSSYLTEEESRELDRLQMSHDYVCPDYLINRLEASVSNNDRGLIHIVMERGMGKSVFCEKINRLFSNPTIIDDNLDVRTYHLSRISTAGEADFLSYIEWLWSKDYLNRNIIIKKHISDYINEGLSYGKAFACFLNDVREYSEKNRQIDKIMMVFDGLDELYLEKIWSYLPDLDDLDSGVYILMTSRDSETEMLPSYVKEKIDSLTSQEEIKVSRKSSEYIAFLNSYIDKTNLKDMNAADRDMLITNSDHRVLSLGVMCRLVESGASIKDFDNNLGLIGKYINILFDSYAEKELNELKEILIILTLLGKYEPLEASAIGQLTNEGALTLKTAGMIRDIMPLMKVERGAHGSVFSIVNDNVAKDIIEQIPDSASYINKLLKYALATYGETEVPETYSGDAVLCSHAIEIMLHQNLGNSNLKLENNTLKDLYDFVDYNINNAYSPYEKQRCVNYCYQLLKAYEYIYGKDDSNTIEIACNYANVLSLAGRSDDAISLLYDIFYRTEKNSEDSNASTCLICCTLISRLLDAIRDSEAEDMLRKLPSHKNEVIGGSESLFYTIQSVRAMVYVRTGRRQDARRLQKEVYDWYCKHNGEFAEETIVAQNNYAVSLLTARKYDEASNLLEKSYKASCAKLGDTDASSMRILYNLAALLLLKKDYQEAAKKLRTLYALSTEALGVEHPQTLDAALMLCDCLSNLNKLEEVKEIITAIDKLVVKQFGVDHVNYIKVLASKVTMSEKAGDYKEALSICSEAIELAYSNLGIRNVITANLLHVAGVLHGNDKQYDQAIELLQDAVSAQKAVCGEKSQEAALELYNLGMTLVNARQFEEGLSAFMEAYDIFKSIFGDKHRNTATMMTNIGSTLHLLERYDEALDYDKKAYETMVKLFGQGHVETLLSLVNLSASELDLNEFQKAYDDAIYAMKLCGEKLGENDDLYLKACQNCARAAEMLGRIDEAIELMTKVCDIRTEVFGSDRISTINSQEYLASLLDKQKSS